MSVAQLQDLVSASPQAEALLRSRLEVMIGEIREGLGEGLKRIVLGGSLARGQGMVLETSSGLALLSDVDLYVVRETPQIEVELDLQRRLQKLVCEDPFFLAPLDLAFVDPGYFASLGPRLPAFQLAHGSRVVHPDTEISIGLESELGLGQREVDPDDATRLLLNRLAESVLLRSQEPRTPFHATHRMKVCIDAPLAWLAATGRYHPSREAQHASMARAVADWDGAAGEWARAGLERMGRWIDAVRRAPLRPEDLREFAHLVDEDQSPQIAHDPVVAWAWPFARALMTGPGLAPQADALLREAVEEGLPRPTDVRVVARWLRRQSPISRLRQARRWAPLAPVATRPWWRYGVGASGDERVYGACALRWAGLEAWRSPLRGLLREPAALGNSSAKDLDQELGTLWSDWILGGGRR